MDTMTTAIQGKRIGLADGLAVLALAFAAAAAVAGLFVPGLYRDTDGWIRQARAADLVTLLAVGPVLAASLVRARAGSPTGRLTALAALGYLVYNYSIFGFSVAINPMTPIHIAVLGLSTWSVVLHLVDLTRRPLESGVEMRLPRRTTAGFLIGVAALFGLMWSGQIAQAITRGANPEELARLGLTTNPVYTLDLAFALPFLAVSGILLLRRRPAGAELALVALTWVVLMGLGVLAIFAFDAAAGALVPMPVVGVIGAITVVGISLTAVGLRRGSYDSTRSMATA